MIRLNAREINLTTNQGTMSSRKKKAHVMILFHSLHAVFGMDFKTLTLSNYGYPIKNRNSKINFLCQNTSSSLELKQD